MAAARCWRHMATSLRADDGGENAVPENIWRVQQATKKDWIASSQQLLARTGRVFMGILSGGGKQVNSVGERSLIGANAGIGISLGDECIVEAGL